MAARQRRVGCAGAIHRAASLWALGGGLVLLAVVAMSVVSVLGGALLDRPFPGDFELVQMGVAVAAFSFLPYAQLEGANVTADIFTTRASPGVLALFALLAALTALGFGVLLLWRMWAGLLDYRRYAETTTILQIPHWVAFVPILLSLALLALAALVSVIEAWSGLRIAGRRSKRR